MKLRGVVTKRLLAITAKFERTFTRFDVIYALSARVFTDINSSLLEKSVVDDINDEWRGLWLALLFYLSAVRSGSGSRRSLNW